MPELRTLMAGLMFGESPRWHDGRLWFSDMGTHQLGTVDLDGRSEVVADVPAGPMGSGWLPGGRLLVVSSLDGRLLRQEPDGSLVTHADLTGLAGHAWGDMVVDGRGNAYLGNLGFDFPEGEFAPGIVALVTPDGSARQVADGVAFPNGMAVTPDNATLILAESYGNRLTAFDIAADGGLSNRRVWADLGTASLTASASTPTAPSGTPTSPTGVASASAKAARCCRPSSSTAAASRARWAARSGGPYS
jgi:sugar lactone lactonase YvrE